METNFGRKKPYPQTFASVYADWSYDELLQKITFLNTRIFKVIHDETQYQGKKYNATHFEVFERKKECK